MLVLTFPLLLFMSAPVFSDETVSRVSAEETLGLLGTPGVHILDARTSSDWKKAEEKIKSAVRVNPHRVSSWADGIPKDERIILYCS